VRDMNRETQAAFGEREREAVRQEHTQSDQHSLTNIV